jgi:hypothetical protein
MSSIEELFPHEVDQLEDDDCPDDCQCSDCEERAWIWERMTETGD